MLSANKDLPVAHFNLGAALQAQGKSAAAVVDQAWQALAKA